MSENVFETVRNCLADSLAVPAERIRPESRLIEDLGADSLDFLDVVFMLEKRFAIRVHDTELDMLTRLDFSSPETMRNGRLTRGAVERLAAIVPALKAEPDPDGVTPGRLFSLITVGTLCAVVERKVAERA